MIVPRNLINIKYFNGKPFLKIFYQFTNSSSDFFNENDDFELINERNKFSILKHIDDRFKYNDYFEFLLEYPSLEGFNNWKQKIFPTKAEDPNSIGYLKENDSCTWEGKEWGGLFKSSNFNASYLEGSVNTSLYWYTIGSKKSYMVENFFPGPCFLESEGIKVQNVLLHIYIPPNIYKKLFNFTCYLKNKLNIILFIIILVL